MGEDKQGRHTPDPVEESQPADNSLVSKLARAYSSLPPEQRKVSAVPENGHAVANPELEDRFQKLLKQLEVLESYQGTKDHKPDPRVVALLEKKLEELRTRADSDLADDGASAEAGPASGVSVQASVRCAQCDHPNSPDTRFCGMCGAETAKTSAAGGKSSAPTRGTILPRHEQPAPALAAEIPVERRSLRGLGIGLLVLALVVLALLAARPWPWWRQQLSGRIAAAPPDAVRAPSPAMTSAAVPAERPADPPVSGIAQTAPETPRSSKAFPEAAAPPPTTIRQHLPGPVPSTSTLPETETPSSPQSEAGSSLPPRTQLSPAEAQRGLISRVNPEYPALARMARVQGTVVLHAIIGKDGTVQQLQVLEGNPLLAESALNAVKNWRYRPYLVDGEAVEVETTVTLTFKGDD